MNKKCAKCLKTVYPTEELKCLDKTWHKFCFKCNACGMTLNMKNYKGYDKMPYCNAHYPQTKHTVVADTPEARRIAENTKIQSQIQYHAEFEKEKGNKISVSTDPETERIKANTAIQSNVNYWGIRDQREAMENRRPNEMVDDVTRRSRNPGKISDYDPADKADFNSPYSQRNNTNVVYDSQRGEGARMRGQRVQPGSIADYDPMNNQHSSVVRNHQVEMGHGYGQPPSPSSQPPPQQYQPPPQQYQPPPQQYQPPPQQYQPPPQQYQQQRIPQSQPPRAAQPPPPKQIRFVAIYDYTAADTDEVSFVEGDIIINPEEVDQGWMTGTVQRTGLHGMLPSNYVEQC